MSESLSRALTLSAPLPSGTESILSEGARAFLVHLTRTHGPRVRQLLEARRERQARFDRGEAPDFLPSTRSIRDGDWTVAPLPEDLLDRRVEITGPVDRKMVINALNSGASAFMADFEDSTAPTFENLLRGQVNVRDAVARTIRHEVDGKVYQLQDRLATLMVRPRGWHLVEKHVRVDGEFVPGALFDFGLFLFHNGDALLGKGTGPYFYLPKLETHLEARLWNDVFVDSQEWLGIPQKSIKATVLIETLPAAFEMDEILYELRDHSAGLNCGRWDYIFSGIKTRRMDPRAVLPDRGQITMTQPSMRAYTQLLVKTCHRRRVHAMGGMAAQIPIKSDPERNAQAIAKVRADKEREVTDGHDGTWVAHPGLVPVAKEVFDRGMPRKNQLANLRADFNATRAELLAIPSGTRTVEGLRHNLRVGIQYLEAWISGQGCVPIYDLMEDAATAEISRSQIWQWARHHSELETGETVTPEWVRKLTDEELGRIRSEVGADRFARGRFVEARGLFDRLALSESFEEFLTLPAYEYLLGQKT
ncbi:MAG: malate synthase A [Deltaproteobacteria bacterium]|nr:malate synthase A [Deltaproteobacteria bacterium]